MRRGGRSYSGTIAVDWFLHCCHCVFEDCSGRKLSVRGDTRWIHVASFYKLSTQIVTFGLVSVCALNAVLTLPSTRYVAKLRVRVKLPRRKGPLLWRGSEAR